MKQERLWTRDFILAVVSGFFAYIVLYTMLTTVAVYAATKFGVSEGLAGFAASISMGGSIVGRFFDGKYSDRIGRRRVAIVSNVLNAVCCALYFLPSSIGALLAIRFVHGVATGCIHNVMATAVIGFIPLSRRAEGIGFYGMNFILAIAIGPALGLSIIGKWSYESLWGVNIGFALIGLLILLAIRFEPAPTVEAEAEGEKTRPRDMGGIGRVFEKSALPLAFMVFLLCACYSSVMAFAETYTLHLGIGWIASPFFVVYSLSILACRPFAGRLADRRGENFVLVPAIIVNAASFLVIGLAGFAQAGPAPVLLMAAAILMAVGFGPVLPIGQAVAVKYIQPPLFSKGVSTFFIFSDGGMGVGALLLGTIAAAAGFSWMFFAEIAVVLAALCIYWGLHGRHHRGSGRDRSV